ncbi:hypothetical protein [Nostoc punctiforme]|uniref:hypothetical protein n=1 Tax=Nostoc punctiforme TaxID=272131 RepID=UPI0003080235
MEDNEVDLMNVLQALKKVNIIDRIHLTSYGLQALIMLCGNDRQPPKVTAE